MNCKNCGAELNENSKFCNNCGTPTDIDNQTSDVVIQSDIQTEESNKTNAIEKKRKGKKILIALSSVLAVIVIIISFSSFLLPKIRYNKAGKNVEAQNYAAAIELYKKLGNYEDSTEKLKSTYLKYAEVLTKNGEFKDAIKYYEAGGAQENDSYYTYARAVNELSEKNYEAAISGLEKVKDIENKEEYTNYLNQAYYGNAEKLFKEKKYNDASIYYKKAKGYKDADTKVNNCQLMIAENYYKEGNLSKAQENYKKLPENFEYNGIKVSQRIKALDKNKDLVKMCGTWSGTGEMSVRQTHDSTGLWDEWTAEYYDTLEIKCILNDDGTFTLKGTANYYKYLNYSSLSYNLKDLNSSTSFEYTGKSIPSTVYDKGNVNIKYNGSSFVLKYDYNNENYSVNFTYRYKSSITYNKKA